MVLLQGPVKFRFDQFTLDKGSRQLVGNAGAIHLSPKAFELLAVLLENRPRVVSKADLQERLWPSTFVVDTNIANLVGEIRQALNDDARNPRCIRTAHRFGYAFCGAVVDVPASGGEENSTSLCWLIKGGRRIRLQPGENIVGRELERGVRVDSPTVSRRHARILIAGPDATLEDLGSKNGTYLRGEPIAVRVPLSDGDEIRVGSVVLRFRMRAAAGSTLTQTSNSSTGDSS